MAQLNVHIRLFSSEDNFIKAGLEEVAKICKSAKTPQIALSGGSTPKKLYKELAKSAPLENTAFFQVDERYVPLNNPDSNYTSINETVLSNKENQPKAFHFFDTSLPIEECLAKYKEELPKTPFDLIILGIGPDGHTASLFPNSPALKEQKSAVAHTQTEQFAIKDRLTLTFPIILKSKKIIVLLKGKEKDVVIKKLMHENLSTDKFPAKELLKHPNLDIFHLLTE